MKSKKEMIEKLVSDFKSYHWKITMLRVSGSSNDPLFLTYYKVLEVLKYNLSYIGFSYTEIIHLVDVKEYKANITEYARLKNI